MLRAVVLALALGACSNGAAFGDAGADAADDAGIYDPHPQTPVWLTGAHVLVSGHDKEGEWDCRTKICRHNENVDMIVWKNSGRRRSISRSSSDDYETRSSTWPQIS